jgi:hypothetical protein
MLAYYWRHINEKLKKELDKKFKGLNKKLDNLIKQQKNLCKPNHSREFHKRVENLSHVSFSENEINVLNKGLQYELPHTNSREWLENLIIVTETAISKLPLQDQDNFRH